MVSDGFRRFQRGFRGSETADFYMRSEMSVCFVLHWGLKMSFCMVQICSHDLFDGS